MNCSKCNNRIQGESGQDYCRELIEPCDEIVFCPYDPLGYEDEEDEE